MDAQDGWMDGWMDKWFIRDKVHGNPKGESFIYMISNLYIWEF